MISICSWIGSQSRQFFSLFVDPIGITLLVASDIGFLPTLQLTRRRTIGSAFSDVSAVAYLDHDAIFKFTAPNFFFLNSVME